MEVILLHFCCAPCGVYPLSALRKEGYQVDGVFFNPNIHPYQEYKKRLETLREFSEIENFKLIVIDEYDLEKYVQMVAYRESIRCKLCYSMRMDRVASVAKKGGYLGFTTTLLVSPRQKHQQVIDACEAAQKKYNVPFIYRDFREGWAKTVQCSKEMGLYRQEYCGCIFSEYQRYKR